MPSNDEINRTRFRDEADVVFKANVSQSNREIHVGLSRFICLIDSRSVRIRNKRQRTKGIHVVDLICCETEDPDFFSIKLIIYKVG